MTFVFQIEGTDENGETVYSNVAATTHSSAGTVDAVAERIPAGTRVTVTEVYSGASYELVSQGTQEGLITADPGAWHDIYQHLRRRSGAGLRRGSTSLITTRTPDGRGNRLDGGDRSKEGAA